LCTPAPSARSPRAWRSPCSGTRRRARSNATRAGSISGSTNARATSMAEHFAPAVDIFEDTDAVVVHAELPGVEPGDVHVRVEHGLLTIAGERKLEGDHAPGRWRRLEIAHGTFARSFSLPRTVSPRTIEAELANGMLTVRIPKTSAARR